MKKIKKINDLIVESCKFYKDVELGRISDGKIVIRNCHLGKHKLIIRSELPLEKNDVEA